MSASNVWPLWFEQAAVHQDYAWFLALLGWGLALVLWRRHPQRGEQWAWVPWTAGALVVGAAVQFGIFNPPFDFFHSRLRPGTLGDYSPALIDPELLGAWLLVICAAVWASGWGWVLARGSGLRWAVLVTAGGAAIWHVAQPEVGAWLLAALLVVLAGLFARRASDVAQRGALILAALVAIFSTVGPLAASLGQLQQSGPPTAMGLAAALVQAAGAAVVVARLWSGAVARQPAERLSRSFIFLAALWLVGGVVLAAQTGADNRRELQRNRLRQAAARAQLLNEQMLQSLDLPLPRLDSLETKLGRVAVPPEAQRPLDQISAFAARELRATLYIARVRIIVLAGDWLVALADSEHPLPEGRIEVLRRATAKDRADWAQARNVIEHSALPEIGHPYYCRAAVKSRDGRMLAWLEHEQVEFFQSIERKWRSGPLLVTALGWLLGATLWLQRRAEREREAAIRAVAVQEEANRVKSAFLAMVSHELRTPLQSFLGYGELLRARHVGDPQSAAWLEAMRQHGEMMARLVNDLIDLGAADAGTLRLRLAPASPGEIVQQAIEGLRVKAEAKGLRLSGEVSTAVPRQLLIDAARWGEIVFNLVGNAVKFTERGRVDVRLAAESEADGRWRLMLSVADTGPGIAPELQPGLFQAFNRLDPTAHHEGAGVGLALSAALCRAMGGGLTVESDGRSGTTFRASVSLATAASDATVPTSIKSAVLHGQRVLVVDDNRLVRELFQAMLIDAGAECVTAATAEAARAALRQAPFDSVVLDVSLPDGSGIELAPQLRDLRHGLRIIGASAHAGEGEQQAALAAGMDAFLIKPIARADLVAALGATSAGSGWGTAPQLEIEQLFRAEAPEDREKIAAAWAARDWRALRASAHYLANSAAVVGDVVLREACEQLVRAAEAKDTALAEQSWNAVDGALQRWLKNFVKTS